MKNSLAALTLLLLAIGSAHAAPAAKRGAAPPEAPALCKIGGLEAKAAQALVANDSIEEGKPDLIKQARMERADCLRKAAEGASSAQRGNIAQQLARNDAYVAQQVDAAFANVEADPARYLSPMLEEMQEEAAEMIENARKVRSVADQCGTWSQPSASTDAAWLNQRLNNYRSCVDNAKNEDTAEVDSEDLEEIAGKVQRLQRYSCSASSSPNCLPRQDLDKVRKLASQSNIKMVERAASVGAGRSDEADEILARVNDSIDRYNEAVARRDQEREERESRRAQQNYYSPPPAPAPAETYRRPSDVSARGIR